LDEARKIIQTSTNEAGTNAAMAGLSGHAKQAQAELDKARAEAEGFGRQGRRRT